MGFISYVCHVASTVSSSLKGWEVIQEGKAEEVAFVLRCESGGVGAVVHGELSVYGRSFLGGGKRHVDGG